MTTQRLTFSNAKKQYWIKSVNSIIHSKRWTYQTDRCDCVITLERAIAKNDFESMHIVLLCCLMEKALRYNYVPILEVRDEKLKFFLINEIRLIEYFRDSAVPHIKTSNDLILNVWRVDYTRSYMYTHSVMNYLKNKYLGDCDLSILKVTMDEILSNVSDHSQCEGLAFSYLYYDELKSKFHFAVCDMGLGIPTTLRNSGRKYSSDIEALRSSLEKGISARTNKYNRGFGLDIVVGNMTEGGFLRIVSNKALLFCSESRERLKMYELDFDFKGNLVYFDLPRDSFQIRTEMNENFI